jgi:hypothetical protein
VQNSSRCQGHTKGTHVENRRPWTPPHSSPWYLSSEKSSMRFAVCDTILFPAQRRSDFCYLGERARLAGESALLKSLLVMMHQPKCRSRSIRTVLRARGIRATARRRHGWEKGPSVGGVGTCRRPPYRGVQPARGRLGSRRLGMAARVDTPHTHTHTCLGLYIVGSKLALGHCLGRVAHCAGMYYFLIYFHRIKKKKSWLVDFQPKF